MAGLGLPCAKERKKDGCQSHNSPNVWKPSGHNAEIWWISGYIIFPNFNIPVLKNKNTYIYCTAAVVANWFK